MNWAKFRNCSNRACRHLFENAELFVSTIFWQKRNLRYAILALLLPFVSFRSALAVKSAAPPSMTLSQACAAVVQDVNEHSSPETPWRIKLRPGGFALWGAEGRTEDDPIMIKFENLQEEGLLRHGDVVSMRAELPAAIPRARAHRARGSVPRGYLEIYFDSKGSASEFYSALDWFVSHRDDPAVKHLGGGGDLSSEQAAIWRAAMTKPILPEAAHEHQVLASSAYQEKDFDKAIDEYMAALEIFPTWPEGQNNLAFLCGETGDYDCAIEHAQDYLLLVPDAPNASAIKDQIIIWKDKLAQEQAQAPPPTEQKQKAKKGFGFGYPGSK